MSVGLGAAAAAAGTGRRGTAVLAAAAAAVVGGGGALPACGRGGGAAGFQRGFTLRWEMEVNVERSEAAGLREPCGGGTSS